MQFPLGPRTNPALQKHPISQTGEHSKISFKLSQVRIQRSCGPHIRNSSFCSLHSCGAKLLALMLIAVDKNIISD